ncbi:MAG: universal stress protein [Candidatus Verstraetearchaeota archaeon]|nr:universal stress protein [Candidatus Verstraetearchaeota archaeon]
MEVKRILVPIDGSPATPRVLEWASRFAKLFACEVVLLHVVVMPPVSDIGGVHAAAKELEDLGQSILNTASGELERRGVKSVHVLDFSVGNAAARIVQVAKDRGVDMIVIGARGQSRIRALLMGSVANSVVNSAPCPVFVVRPCGELG